MILALFWIYIQQRQIDGRLFLLKSLQHNFTGISFLEGTQIKFKSNTKDKNQILR